MNTAHVQFEKERLLAHFKRHDKHILANKHKYSYSYIQGSCLGGPLLIIQPIALNTHPIHIFYTQKKYLSKNQILDKIRNIDTTKTYNQTIEWL